MKKARAQNISTAAPKPKSTTILMTAQTDSEKQNKPFRETTKSSKPTFKAGKGGEGIRKGFLG